MNRFQYHYLFLPDVVPRTGAVISPSCPADHLLHRHHAAENVQVGGDTPALIPNRKIAFE